MKYCWNLLLLLVSIHISFSQPLKIYHLDVDQADATLFIAPNGSTLLVDAGNNKQGERIKKILQKEGINTINHFVNTHYHADHYGSIDELYNDPEINIEIAYDRGHKKDLPQRKKMQYSYIGYFTTVGKNAFPLNPGMEILLDPSMSIKCISSNGNIINEDYNQDTDDENDNSISLLIEYGNFRYFIGGDIEKHTESKIAKHDLVKNVDVYQANHHGSHSSSSKAFMLDLMPSVIVISNGNTERYGHPRQVTLDTYYGLQPSPDVYQTNKFLANNLKAGNVADSLIADLDFEGDEGTILIEVVSDSFQVNYSGREYQYKVKKKAAKKGHFVIKSLLPDPVEPDKQYESITLMNNTKESISIKGWYFKDLNDKKWHINHDDSVKPGQQIKLLRENKPMSLSNKGDRITLYNSKNEIIDKVQYYSCKEGELIKTGHY